MSDLNGTAVPPPSPPLLDMTDEAIRLVPAQLRALADRIEDGRQMWAGWAIVILPGAHGPWPSINTFGPPAVQGASTWAELDLAKTYLINSFVRGCG